MKKTIRNQMRQMLLSMPADEAARRSRDACDAVAALAEFAAADSLMLYLPIPGEIDTTALTLAAWQAGKTVLVPQVNWQQRHMIAVRITSLDSEMVTGSYGTRHPRDGEPWPAADIGLVIVPGLAFDRRGNRLGRGGGFYDRFLAAADLRAATVGLAFDEQVLDKLPTEPNDRPVQIIATDKQVLRFNIEAAPPA